MSDIKFRAWSKKQKKFLATGFHIVGETTLFNLMDQYSVEALDDLVIDQFITNRCGFDVYDNDIIDYEHLEGFKGIAAITWYDSLLAWGLFTKRAILLGDCQINKIVGNIHQNPELAL